MRCFPRILTRLTRLTRPKPAGKLLPLSGEGEWQADKEGQTLSADRIAGTGPKTTEDSRGFDSDAADGIEKTLVSEQLSDEGRTDSGSDDGAARTDRLSSQELSGAEAAQGSGLVIQLRSLREQGTPQSNEADYELLNLLGEGGMGKVFNARQTSIDRNVAVKMLKSRRSSRKRDQHSKFLAEAVVTGELDHPNIVPIYDVGKDENDALFYSMKNVTGNPWLDTIHQKSTHDNLEVLLSVADAVAFAHARGVVHRDLKPENVMLGEFGEVLVMDWGLAMPTEKFGKQRGIIRSSSMGGTPAYMAPEMASGPIQKIGPHSDIYLLGAILFEIVTGRPPHRGKNAMKCLMAAARNKIVQTDHTGELIEIAFKAMSTDSKDRYKSVQEFQAAVRTYLAHSESITLAAMAEEDLERAQRSDSYEAYAKARFGFEEALKLWDGNKRARTRLGAARLAYAHCALDKGDYDLAASLLDSSDRSHDKLKVDIAKAREERDARQKRLVAAKRAGRAMLAALFLVVSGAAFLINNARIVADNERQNAVEAKVVADNERQNAVEARNDAVVAQKAAEEAQKLEASLRKQAVDALASEKIAKENEAKQRKEAVAQKTVASLNAIMAKEQEQIATAAAEAERVAKLEADQRRQEAVAQQIVASLNAIMAKEQEQIATAAAEAEEKAKDAAIIARKKAEDSAEAERLAKIQAEQRRQQAVAQQIVASLNAIMAKEQEQIATAAAEAEEKAKDAAIIARKKAEDSAEAERLAKIQAEQRRQQAVAQEIVARVNAMMAKEQEQVATAAAEAEREAKINEQREAYNSKIGLAAAKIEENAFDAAREVLGSTSKRFRNWEWGYLMRLCQQFEREYKVKGHPLESVALINGGRQFVIGGQGWAEIRDIDDYEGKVPPEVALHNVAFKDTVQKLEPAQLKLNPSVTVYDVAVSPNGWIALATDDYEKGFLKLWHPQENKFLEGLFGGTDIYYGSEVEYYEKLKSRHMDPVVSVRFSRDGKKLLTASEDGTARVWNVEPGNQQGTQLAVLEGHTDTVWDAVFFPNGETQIVTVSEDRTAIIWRDETGRWEDPKNIKPLAFRGHESPIYAVACSPDGQYVATGDYDRRVLLWRPADIPQIDRLTLIQKSLAGETIPLTPYRELLGHTAAISSIEFGRTAGEDARDLRLLTGSNDHTIKVWTISRDNSQSKTTPVKTFRGHGGWVRDCVWVSAPEGERILSVSHDETAKLWNPENDATAELELVNGSPLDAVAFSKDSKEFATASRDQTARIYQLEKGQIKHEQILAEGHNNLVTAGVYFEGGKKLVTTGYDGTARVWDVSAKTQLLTLKGTGQAGAVAVSADGQWILTGSDNKQAKLWNAQQGERLTAFGAHSGQVTAVAFAHKTNADGNLTLATADAEGHIVLWKWSPGSKTEPARIENLEFKNSKEHKAHNARVVALRFLPDDGRLLSAGHTIVAQWDLSTYQEVDRLRLSHPKEVRSMALTPNGRWLVTTCFDDKVPGVIRLWNVEDAKIVNKFRPQGWVRTLVRNLQSQFYTKNTKKVPNETMRKAFELLAPQGDYEKFLQSGDWQQDLDQLVSRIPSEVQNLKSPPKKLAEKLAELIPGVSADDLLLAQTNSVAISPDGKYIAATNRFDRITYVWRLSANPAADQKRKPFILDDSLESREVWAAAFSDSSEQTELAVLGMSDARLWKRLNANEEGIIYSKPTSTLDAQGDVASIGFSPDGQYFVTASGGQDRAARVWNVQTGKSVAKFQGVHTETINAAVFSPDGKLILTVSNDDPARR